MTQQETKAVEIVKKTIEISRTTNTVENCIVGMMMPFIKGLLEPHKPSERPNIKEFFPTDAQISDVHDEITTAPRLYAYMQALDAYIDILEAKPSEPETNVGEAGEELVERIEKIIYSKSHELYDSQDENTGEFVIDAFDIKGSARKIAALMQNCENQEESRNISQTDKELLGALKASLSFSMQVLTQKQHAQMLSTTTESNNELHRLIEIQKRAISNYEKQSK